MRIPIFLLLAFSAMVLSGSAWAQATKTQPAPAAEAKPVFNPMGAGLVVPAGEGISPLLEGEKIPIYEQPDLKSKQVGVLQAGGGKNPYQLHVIAKDEVDPEWKETWLRRMMKKTAPIVTTTVPVSEFMVSPTQKGIMIVTVNGSWLQIAQGWFQWTTTLVEHASFQAWSELYQEASFSAFQLSNARQGKADIVPLGVVTLQGGKQPVQAQTSARFIVLDARPEALEVKITGGTCKGTKPAPDDGAIGWVNLFAPTGAPQLLLQPEQCPEDAKPTQ